MDMLNTSVGFIHSICALVCQATEALSWEQVDKNIKKRSKRNAFVILPLTYARMHLESALMNLLLWVNFLNYLFDSVSVKLKLNWIWFTVHSCISLLRLSNKIPQTGWLNRNLFSHSAGGQKSKIKGSAGLISSEVSLLTCRWPSSPCVFTWTWLHACAFLESLLCVLSSSSHKDTSQIGFMPTLTFKLNYLFKGPKPNTVAFWSTGG